MVDTDHGARERRAAAGLLDALPEGVAVDGPIQASVTADLLPDGRFGSEWLVVTSDRVRVYTEDAQEPTLRLDLPLRELKSVHVQQLIGGALATAGNLAFFGEGNGWFDALDARSGKLLWRYSLGAGVNAPPVTYTVNGQQYIAVAAGGNFQLTFAYGDIVAIFKLNPSSASSPKP